MNKKPNGITAYNAGWVQKVNIQISGARKVDAEAEAVTLSAENLNDTNSIEQPEKIVPRTEKVCILSSDFTREPPPYCITILKIKT